MNKKQVNAFTKALIVILIVFFSVWICFEIAEGSNQKQAERIPVEIPTGTICFGNADGDYQPTDCGQFEVYNEVGN